MTWLIFNTWCSSRWTRLSRRIRSTEHTFETFYHYTFVRRLLHKGRLFAKSIAGFFTILQQGKPVAGSYVAAIKITFFWGLQPSVEFSDDSQERVVLCHDECLQFWGKGIMIRWRSSRHFPSGSIEKKLCQRVAPTSYTTLQKYFGIALTDLPFWRAKVLPTIACNKNSP